MKIWAVATIARQFDGDIITLRFEKAFKTKELADTHVKNLAKNTMENITIPGGGVVEFYCERGVHELEVEE